MKIDILTLFPNIFDSYFKESLFSRAQKSNLLNVKIHNLRDYTKGKHHKADDKPFGGGPGMVLMVEPIYTAIQSIKSSDISCGLGDKKLNRFILPVFFI